MTEGQLEILKITTEMASGHTGEWGGYNGPDDEFCNEYIHQVRNNEIIKNDSLTSRPLNNFGISKTYISFLKERSSPFRYSKNFPEISLDLFDYNRACIDTSPAYKGGVKYDSTYSCMLSLVQGKELSSGGWSLFHIEDAGYTSILGGGNHRSLASMLLGKKKISPDQLDFYSGTGTDILLNTSILEIENLLGRTLFISDYQNDEEVESIKYFLNNLNDFEKRLLGKYMEKFTFRDWSGNFTSKLFIDRLIEGIGEIREVLGIVQKSRDSWFYNLKLKYFLEQTDYFKEIEELILDVEKD